MIELSLPAPLSVNKTRRINWAAHRKAKAWLRAADALTTAAWAGGRRPNEILNKFEATIILSDDLTKTDADNSVKMVLDYARYLGLVRDDSPKYMRRVVIEFGDAPEGCRLILRPLE
jgi:hypothetical protein